MTYNVFSGTLNLTQPTTHVVVCMYDGRCAMAWYMALERKHLGSSLKWVRMRHQSSWSHSSPSSQVSVCPWTTAWLSDCTVSGLRFKSTSQISLCGQLGYCLTALWGSSSSSQVSVYGQLGDYVTALWVVWGSSQNSQVSVCPWTTVWLSDCTVGGLRFKLKFTGICPWTIRWLSDCSVGGLQSYFHCTQSNWSSLWLSALTSILMYDKGMMSSATLIHGRLVLQAGLLHWHST